MTFKIQRLVCEHRVMRSTSTQLLVVNAHNCWLQIGALDCPVLRMNIGGLYNKQIFRRSRSLEHGP